MAVQFVPVRPGRGNTLGTMFRKRWRQACGSVGMILRATGIGPGLGWPDGRGGRGAEGYVPSATDSRNKSHPTEPLEQEMAGGKK